MYTYVTIARTSPETNGYTPTHTRTRTRNQLRAHTRIEERPKTAETVYTRQAIGKGVLVGGQKKQNRLLKLLSCELEKN